MNTRAARFFRLSLLVLGRKQDRSCATVGLGDDPKLLALSGLVVAQQPETLLECQLVFLLVVVGKLAKVAGHVTAQKLNRCLSGDLERFFGSGRDEGLA
jgi:hypothetical protein